MTTGRQRKILVIDASRTNLGVIGRRLAHHGYAAILAEDGMSALRRIAAGGIDLVLLDMALARPSGMRVLDDIRGDSATAGLPVVMLTARSDPAAAVEALAGGADDHIAKPFDFDIAAAQIARLLARTNQLTALTRANLALDAGAATRAVEIGKVKTALADTRADRKRLIASIQALNDEVERLAATD